MNIKYHDENGKIICQECGKSYNQITFTHLKNSHKMTLDDYKAKYEGYPLTSKEFRARQRYNRSEVLGKEPATEDLLEELVECSECLEDGDSIINEIIEETEEKIIDEVIPFPEKRKIYKYLKKLLPNIQNNYFIEKMTLGGMLEYRFVTDFADPMAKIDLEFENAGWHNMERYQDPNRNFKLQRDGWKIITFRTVPDFDKIREEIYKHIN